MGAAKMAMEIYPTMGFSGIEGGRMDERLASIIIPSKGRPYQLRDCVDGILATTAGYQIEIIIVVDDLEGYADLLKDYPVKLIHQDEPGAIRGWNKGLKESQGEIVVM